MLDLDPSRPAAPPRDAATLIVVRDGASGLEVFCVERQKVGFLGGAVVFPGGKLDPSDLDPGWATLSTPPRAPAGSTEAEVTTWRGIAVAACREALEEAAILPLEGAARDHATLLSWQARLAKKKGGPAPQTTLWALLTEAGVKLDLAALHPMARWVTPVAESRRFDARFFLYVADAALTGAHDDHETTASFWATPSEVMRRFVARELQLAPPTHRTLERLAAVADSRGAVAMAAGACLEPIRPRLVRHADARGETVALVLPGDPEHEVREARSPGRSRYVLRGDRFLPEDPA
jgi:8-oxo-dGTP pyrophosphatase MutT (NUDIX family)